MRCIRRLYTLRNSPSSTQLHGVCQEYLEGALPQGCFDGPCIASNKESLPECLETLSSMAVLSQQGFYRHVGLTDSPVVRIQDDCIQTRVPIEESKLSAGTVHRLGDRSSIFCYDLVGFSLTARQDSFGAIQ
jgi:hypothetical protein